LLRVKTGLQPWSGQAGQATVEYVLMLATVAVVLSAFLTAFHTHIVRWFFTFIGQLLTS
jgi:Flp pilus assembly pilin Flp